MRALILVSAVFVLAACSNNDQRDNSMNVDENLTAENIVSNDVTAIDAVTGDAANLAEAAEINDIGPAVDSADLNAASPAKPGSSKPAAKKAADKPAAAPKPAGATSNSSE
ncbi:MAG TPA: hypothetical protein VIL42_01220 [Sphingomicrobium sp.]|jgi:uncharacterized membrane protein